jgi:hypothetical protein
MSENSKRDELGVRKQEYRRFKEGEDYLPVCASEETAIIDVIIDRFRPGKTTYRKYENLEEFKEVVRDYFEYIKSNNAKGSKLIPDICGFTLFAGIHRSTLDDWVTRRPGEYAETVRMLKNAIAACKTQLALQNKIPAVVFIASMNNDHNWTTNTKVEITTPSNQLQPTMSMEEIAEKVAKDVVIDDDFEE